MYGYIYKITNKINGKFYIGKHKYTGPGLDPKYMGSGVQIKNAIRKYGKENFVVELLFYKLSLKV